MNESDISQKLVDQIKQAAGTNTGLSIVGGGSHGFLCPGRTGEVIAVSNHQGIIDYQPTELSLQVRAGTTVRAIQQTLAQQGQMLPFEPAEEDGRATIGGVVATGLAGPRRAYVGGVADSVLGVTLLNGRGDILRFGGQVMKNVAGFDVSRYVVGGYGCSGVLLDVSFKVLPVPSCEKTFVKQIDQQQLAELFRRLRGHPLTASSYHNRELRLRLSTGSEASIKKSVEIIQGEEVIDAEKYWFDLGERKLSFFHNPRRLSLCMMPAATDFDVVGEQMVEWQGAKRWLVDSSMPISEIRQFLKAHGGYLLSFTSDEKRSVDSVDSVDSVGTTGLARSAKKAKEQLQTLSPLHMLQQRLRLAFDPQGLFNRGQALMPWLELDPSEQV